MEKYVGIKREFRNFCPKITKFALENRFEAYQNTFFEKSLFSRQISRFFDVFEQLEVIDFALCCLCD
ncbi:hypothetical protein J4457_03775 [Candidatus Woesearchaeota archaeon]|nr:hypothetical protein [Candidatus Woesearchaeota archaeon]